MKLKKGDKVVVIAGKSKGETGAIVRAFPKENLVLIDGVNVVKRHRRATRQGGKGQIIDKPMPIHVSNVMLADPKDGKPTRVKVTREGGVAVRVAVKSGTTIK
jgi:large subunit ribosomal protein L24